METINLELRELQQRYSATSFGQQTIWQLLGFAVVMLSGLYFQTNALRNEYNARFEKLEQRITDIEKNINSRFEDLKQEVRANRK